MQTSAALLASVVLAGCAGADQTRTVPADPDLDQHLSEARASTVPLYWAGRAAAGLELTAVAVHGAGRVAFHYGTCELPQGEGGCARPIQIQHFPFSAAQWRRASGCEALEPLRGVPAARHDGLVLFTERRVVKVYARSGQEEREVVLALRPLAGGDAAEPLPPPADGVRTLVERVCR